MPFLTTALHHPRKLFLRRALFQIHLWAGVLLSLYVIVIALTGSLLVFRGEIITAQLPATFTPYNPAQTATIPQVLAAFQSAYPTTHLNNLTLPTPAYPAFVLSINNSFLVADPTTAVIHPRPHTWIDTVYDLHVYLLLNKTYGMQINAIGAAILLILCLTGLVIWWPGIKLWTRAVTINLRHNWRRINFDAHSAIGIWTLLFVSWWSLSGLYFGFYQQFTATVAAISPLVGMTSPKPPPQPPDDHHRVPLETLLAAIHQASPTGHLYSLSDPTLTGPTVYALVDLGAPADFSHRDIITLSTRDAHVLTNWHYGRNQTLGDWFIWAQHPIHFGTLWGTPIKILWALLGLSLATLSATGLLMYWNRYLRKIIKR